MGLVASRHVGSSRTRAQTRVPCIGRQILNHCATREALLFDFVKKKKEEGSIDSSDKEIVAEAERLDVKAMGPLILTEVLFNKNIREQIKKYRAPILTILSQQKSSTVPSSLFGVCGSNAPSSAHLQDSTYLEGDVLCRPFGGRSHP